MIKILEVDGGGAKGIIPLTVLKNIEKEVGKPIYEIFDLMVGTSVGAIICGILSTNKISAHDFHKEMKSVMGDMFRSRFRIPIIQPKYSRKGFINCFTENVGADFLMSDCLTKFMCTAVSKRDGLTHYFKSWENEDGKIKLLDAINRSYAAPLYFGSIKDNDQVWLDGGVGNANCPLDEVFIETIRQNWLNSEKIHILSLGTGGSANTVSFKEAKKWGNIGDLLFYMSPQDGGRGRIQSVPRRVFVMSQLGNYLDSFSFNRVNCWLPEYMNIIDGVKYINDYNNYGEEISDRVNYNILG